MSGGAAVGESQSCARTGCWGADRREEPTEGHPHPCEPCHSAQHFSAIENASGLRLSLPRGSDRCPQRKAAQFKQQVLQLRRAQAAPNCPSDCKQHMLPHGRPDTGSPTETLPKTKYPARRRCSRDGQGPGERQDEGLMQMPVKDAF